MCRAPQLLSLVSNNQYAGKTHDTTEIARITNTTFEDELLRVDNEYFEAPHGLTTAYPHPRNLPQAYPLPPHSLPTACPMPTHHHFLSNLTPAAHRTTKPQLQHPLLPNPLPSHYPSATYMTSYLPNCAYHII